MNLVQKCGVSDGGMRLIGLGDTQNSAANNNTGTAGLSPRDTQSV